MYAYSLNTSLSWQRSRVEGIRLKWGLVFFLIAFEFSLTGFRQADYEQAKKLAQQKKWAESAVIYRSLLGEGSEVEATEQLDFIFEFTRVLTFAGRREEALSLLSQRMNRKNGTHRAVVLRRLNVLSRIFLSETTSKVYQQGIQFLDARKLSDAQARFESAFATEPDNIEILIRLGQTHFLKKEFDKTIEKLRLARRLNPYEPETRLWLGQALRQSGETKESLEELFIAKRDLPHSEIAAVWYSEALFSAGQKNLAISVLEKQIRTEPLQVLVLVTMAKLKLMSVSPSDSVTLWSIRKDLQLALSRVDQYERGKGERFEGVLGIDSRNSKAMKEEIVALQERVEGRLEGKPPMPEKSPKDAEPNNDETD